MSQISKSTSIPVGRNPASDLRLTAFVAAVAVAVAAISVTIALQGGRSGEGEPTRAGVAPAAALGRSDDFGTRHAPQAAALGRSDDFALRQRDVAAMPLPSLSRTDDYGTRHATGQ